MLVIKKAVPLHSLSEKTPGAQEKRSLFDILEQEKRQGSAALLLSSRRDEYVKRTSILLYFIYIGEERLLGRTDKKRQFVPLTGLTKIHSYNEEFDPGSG